MTDTPTRLRGPVAATLFAVAVAAGSTAFGNSALAGAEPSDDSWDIEAYDDCMSKTVRNPDLCCLDSGGVPTSDADDTQADGSPNCYAPPARAEDAQQPTTPPRLSPEAVPGDLPVATGPQTPGAPGPQSPVLPGRQLNTAG